MAANLMGLGLTVSASSLHRAQRAKGEEIANMRAQMSCSTMSC